MEMEGKMKKKEYISPLWDKMNVFFDSCNNYYIDNFYFTIYTVLHFLR